MLFYSSHWCNKEQTLNILFLVPPRYKLPPAYMVFYTLCSFPNDFLWALVLVTKAWVLNITRQDSTTVKKFVHLVDLHSTSLTSDLYYKFFKQYVVIIMTGVCFLKAQHRRNHKKNSTYLSEVWLQLQIQFSSLWCTTWCVNSSCWATRHFILG